jgi:glycosyltransferase involved in cell wall biosynthesis
MPRLRICLLCTDVSRNAFGRAYLLARVLACDHEVRVVGPQFGPSIWPPVAGLLEKHGIQVTAVPSHGYPRFLASAQKLWKAIRADLVYALKPYPTSFGLGLLYRRAKNVPLVLDIDDWELGTFRAMGRGQLLRTIMAGITSPNNYLWLRPLYGQIARADAITVSSRFLQRKYGGVLMPHGRDTTVMDPARVTDDEVRRQWGLAGKVVMFLGTLRPYKGIEDLIAAVHRLARPDVWCVIIGADEECSHTAHLRALAGKQVQLLPMCPFDQIPVLIASADIVVVPQQRTPFTEAQVPAKIFDAMAMARPIVSTAVSDIPQILDGCGIIVPPGDVDALAEAIAYLLDHPAEAQGLGLAAREKCVREFSWDRMQSTLRRLIEPLTGSTGT